MRHFSAIILIIALIAQNYNRYIVVLNYELNKEYIAKNLCENRNKPKCCCAGKCFLKKQLAKTDKEQELPGSNSNKSINEIIFFAEQTAYSFNVPVQTLPQQKLSVNNTPFITQDHYGAVFHPPQA